MTDTKQICEEIKMPVQYDAGHLRDRTGALLLCCQSNDDDVDANNGNQIVDALNRTADLEAKLQLAVEALEHYADVENWICTICDNSNYTCINTTHRLAYWEGLGRHGHSKAQEVLAKIKEPSKGRDV